MRCVSRVGFSFLLFLLAVCLGFWLSSKTIIPSDKIEEIVVLERFARLRRLMNAGELTTVIAQVDVSVTPAASTKILGLETGQTVLTYQATGEVRLGVDLRLLDESSIRVDDSGRITIFLPAPQVLSVTLVDGKTLVTEYRGFYVDRRTSTELRDNVAAFARQEVLSVVCADADLFERVKMQTQRVVQSFFPGEDVLLEFQEYMNCGKED